jgi:anaerobic magnesium-protoporphyrin IX monomethyl ester cyclase
MRVLLVQPNYSHTRQSGAWLINPPLGLAYIAAVLEKNEIEVNILDANALNLTPKEVAKKAKKYNIVGVSLLTPAHNFGVSLIKKLPNDILKVSGGPHATGLPEELLKDGFDVAVRGEGEFTFLDMAKEKPLEKIDGISYKKSGKIVHNKNSMPINPNILPFPARYLLPSNGVDLPYISAGTIYRPWAPIFTSRGCPYNCYYCMKRVFGLKFRPRTPENVLAEIQFLVEEYGVRELNISDDAFNINLERVEKILDGIIKLKKESGREIFLRVANGMRVDRVTENFLKKMKKAGCIHIAYGLESGNQKVLNKIPKNVTLEQMRRGVKLTKKVGIPSVSGFFMLGLIGDSKKTIEDTIKFAKSLDLDRVSISLTTPYPGTRLFEEIKKNGKFLFNFRNWEDYHHTSGRMSFTHPDVASPKVVEDMYQKYYKEFFFRPKYVIKQISKIRSFGQLQMMSRGLIAIIKSSLKKQPTMK